MCIDRTTEHTLSIFLWTGQLFLKHCTSVNVGSMLGQRRRRWPDIKTALGQCLICVVSCNEFFFFFANINAISL